MELTHEKHSGHFMYVSTVKERDYELFCERSLVLPDTSKTSGGTALLSYPCDMPEELGWENAPSPSPGAKVTTARQTMWLLVKILPSILAVFIIAIAFILHRRRKARARRRYLMMNEVALSDLSNDV